jgi:hypothetical protein
MGGGAEGGSGGGVKTACGSLERNHALGCRFGRERKRTEISHMVILTLDRTGKESKAKLSLAAMLKQAAQKVEQTEVYT